MCFKCVLRAVLAEEELAKAGNATPTPVSYDDIDRDHLKAQVNLTNAQAVLRLAEAANSLNMINATAEEQGVLRLITALLPAKAEPTKTEHARAVDPRENTVGQTDQSASVANQPLANETPAPVDEFEGLPAMLKEYVLSMRKLGVEVEVVRLPL